MTYLKWWLAGVSCEVLAFVLTLPALLFMGLVSLVQRGCDRAEIEMELASAEARIRRDRKQLRGQRK
jgi:hypothetical protein